MNLISEIVFESYKEYMDELPVNGIPEAMRDNEWYGVYPSDLDQYLSSFSLGVRLEVMSMVSSYMIDRKIEEIYKQYQ